MSGWDEEEEEEVKLEDESGKFTMCLILWVWISLFIDKLYELLGLVYFSINLFSTLYMFLSIRISCLFQLLSHELYISLTGKIDLKSDQSFWYFFFFS